MLKKVIRPDGKTVSFEYDALGRRTAKIFDHKITRWVWDGNTPLHEWQYALNEKPKAIIDASGMLAKDKEEPVENLVTWIFDEDSFRPAAKIEHGDTFSIISDYLGTPAEAYDNKGQKVWEVELETYGKVKSCKGDQSFVPFRFQGQYEDIETGLYYNRFRYYSPEEGIYVSQDPIKLLGGLKLFSYVDDPNWWLDVFGLTGTYFFTDGTTTYVGKGPKDRMYESMKQRVGGSSKVTQGVHHDFGNGDTGLMVESALMDKYNAVADPNFANAINSPGKKKLEALKTSNPAAYNDIINKANQVDADFKAAAGIVCK